MANGIQSTTNLLSQYDIREGKVLEYEASRVRVGFATLAFGSAQFYTGDGISATAQITAALNISNIVAVLPIQCTVTGVNASWDSVSGVIRFYGAGSGASAVKLVECISGQLALSGQSMIVEVIGT